MESIPINDIKTLIEWNLENSSTINGEVRFLFRGVSKSEHRLIPKICRTIKETSLAIDPSLRLKLLQDYLKIHLPAYGYDLHNYDEKHKLWKELFIAQHYGAATNLLDFTRNPLVGAFFACYKDEDFDSKIYAIRIQEQDWRKDKFDAESLNYNIASFDLLSSKNSEGFLGWSPYELPRTLFVVPPLIDKRIQAQIGIFCCFSQNNALIPLNEQNEFNGKEIHETGFIQEFLIKKESKEKIKKELNKLGINHMSLFPDMSGFGEFVTWKLLNNEAE